MMSNMAENLAKGQGIVSRWWRPSLGVVWGIREGEGTRHFYTCHHSPFILMTSLRMKDSCPHFAKRHL